MLRAVWQRDLGVRKYPFQALWYFWMHILYMIARGKQPAADRAYQAAEKRPTGHVFQRGVDDDTVGQAREKRHQLNGYRET